LIAQPTEGAALIVTRPRLQEPDTSPPRVVRLRITGATVAGVPVVDGVAVRVLLGAGVAEDADGDGEDEDESPAPSAPPGTPASASVTWLPPGSVKGSPTSPAAPNPTPTAAAAKSAHRATSPSRLRTGRSCRPVR
jgi:hypothetical protein